MRVKEDHINRYGHKCKNLINAGAGIVIGCPSGCPPMPKSLEDLGPNPMGMEKLTSKPKPEKYQHPWTHLEGMHGRCIVEEGKKNVPY